MSHATSRPGTGLARAESVSDFLPPCSNYLCGSEWAKNIALSANGPSLNPAAVMTCLVKRQTQRETDRDSDRERKRKRETDRQTGRQIKKNKRGEGIERKHDTEGEGGGREREREIERDRERECVCVRE
jgi:hypothetical protein